VFARVRQLMLGCVASRLRALPALVACLLVVALACGGKAKSTAPAEPPEEVVRKVLAAVNSHDVDAAYSRLSIEARKTLSRDEAARLFIFSGLAGFQASLDGIDEETVNGQMAEIELSISIRFRGREFSQKDVAFLVIEDGAWKLSDHFLQTLETASGIAPAPTIGPRDFGSDGCVKGDIMAGVWLPSRLKVLDPCVTVAGVVVAVQLPAQGEGDGDLTFDIRVSGNDERLLNDVNRRRGNTLHIEVVPADQDRIAPPARGDRVRVQGPWVLDTAHGHNEVHPAWKLDVLPP
jgi:hypothetical protein